MIKQFQDRFITLSLVNFGNLKTNLIKYFKHSVCFDCFNNYKNKTKVIEEGSKKRVSCAHKIIKSAFIGRYLLFAK